MIKLFLLGSYLGNEVTEKAKEIIDREDKKQKGGNEGGEKEKKTRRTRKTI